MFIKPKKLIIEYVKITCNYLLYSNCFKKACSEISYYLLSELINEFAYHKNVLKLQKLEY